MGGRGLPGSTELVVVSGAVSDMPGYCGSGLHGSQPGAGHRSSVLQSRLAAHPLSGCKSTLTFSPLLSMPTVG